jgi:hypothetical protein
MNPRKDLYAQYQVMILSQKIHQMKIRLIDYQFDLTIILISNHSYKVFLLLYIKYN